LKEILCDFAIIIPLYNPSVGWAEEIMETVGNIQSNFHKSKIIVLLVDDGSKSKLNFGPFKENADLYKILIQPINKGKGSAVRKGLSEIKSRYYVYTDWDIPFGTDSIINVMNTISTKSIDIVLAKRSPAYYRMLPFKRRVISKILLFINYFIFNGRFNDTQAGLKGYSQDGVQLVKSGKINGFLFEIEYLLQAIKLNLTFAQVEVTPRKNLKVQNVKVRIIYSNLLTYIKLLILKS
jgi:glycosyltransferase involved in cell wall biosynthesis